MCKIIELTGITKERRPRKRIPFDAKCEVCGCSYSDFRLRRFNDWIVCEKHYNQLEKYGRIIDATVRIHKKPIETCCICGKIKRSLFKGKPYCTRHYLQISRHGKIFKRTIYDSNEYVLHDDYAEIVTYDKNGEKAGSTKVDLDKVQQLKKYKIYIREMDNRPYAFINMKDGIKIKLNRYLLGYDTPKKWDDKIVVDHINGDSLDNRLCNLRIATIQQNTFNMKKKHRFVGVRYNKVSHKWTANIFHNYHGKQLGTFNTKAEALLCRLKAEKETFKNYSGNYDLFYVLDLPSPIDELNKIINSQEGA